MKQPLKNCSEITLHTPRWQNNRCCNATIRQIHTALATSYDGKVYQLYCQLNRWHTVLRQDARHGD